MMAQISAGGFKLRKTEKPSAAAGLLRKTEKPSAAAGLLRKTSSGGRKSLFATLMEGVEARRLAHADETDDEDEFDT
jgi:hypothetical protein